jgi:hypothetical protein
MTFEERQDHVVELRRLLEVAVEALQNAEGCKTVEDFDANVEGAKAAIDAALSDWAEVAP